LLSFQTYEFIYEIVLAPNFYLGFAASSFLFYISYPSATIFTFVFFFSLHIFASAILISPASHTPSDTLSPLLLLFCNQSQGYNI